MNHFFATYIDFIQSVGFVFLLTLTVFVSGKLFLDNKKEGFFVDVGAHHPIRFSNTFLFYKKG